MEVLVVAPWPWQHLLPGGSCVTGDPAAGCPSGQRLPSVTPVHLRQVREMQTSNPPFSQTPAACPAVLAAGCWDSAARRVATVTVAAWSGSVSPQGLVLCVLCVAAACLPALQPGAEALLELELCAHLGAQQPVWGMAGSPLGRGVPVKCRGP